MKHKDKITLSIFDADIWQQGFEHTQEPVLIVLSDLSREYLRLKDEHGKAPQHLKKNLYGRLKRLEGLIKAMHESYKQGRDYVGSLVTSLYVEFERMRINKDREIDEMHKSYKFMAEMALNLNERNISPQLKRA